MKISESSITIKQAVIELPNGFQVTFPEMPLVDLIGKLFEIYGASIEIKLPDEVKTRFEREAIAAWHNAPGWPTKEAYVSLYVEMKTEQYFTTQRHLKAINEYVIAGMTKAPENHAADQSFKDKFPGTTIEDLEEALTIRKYENAS